MTKAEIVNEVAKATGIEKITVQTVVEAFMESVKDSLSKGNTVYLRGFGSFIIKHRSDFNTKQRFCKLHILIKNCYSPVCYFNGRRSFLKLLLSDGNCLYITESAEN